MSSVTSAQDEQQSASSSQPATQGQLPLEELQMFSEVFNLIRRAYVEEISDKALFNSAIDGMLSQLDPHSMFLDQNQLKSIIDDTRGDFYGIGIRLEKRHELLTIKEVIPGSPAEQQHLQSGDIILQINSTPSADLSLSAALNLLKSDSKTKLQLKVMDSDSNKVRDIRIKRSKLHYVDTKAKRLEPGYEYIYIKSFQQETPATVRDLLLGYSQQNVQGLILDLRDNPGGLLSAAVDVADLFLRGGLITYTQGRPSNSRQDFLATSFDVSKNMQMAVLINHNSASAAEIVAAALQDHQRAVLVGETSFGKGSIQTVIPIADERAVKLTTSLYYTPAGRTINERGVIPDVAVEGDYQSNQSYDKQLAVALKLVKSNVEKANNSARKFLQPID